MYDIERVNSSQCHIYQRLGGDLAYVKNSVNSSQLSHFSSTRRIVVHGCTVLILHN